MSLCTCKHEYMGAWTNCEHFIKITEWKLQNWPACREMLFLQVIPPLPHLPYSIFRRVSLSLSHTHSMRWLRLVGSLKLHVSFAKESYKRDDILQKRPRIVRSLLVVATLFLFLFTTVFLSLPHTHTTHHTHIQHITHTYNMRAMLAVHVHIHRTHTNTRIHTHTHTHTHAHTHTHTRTRAHTHTYTRYV